MKKLTFKGDSSIQTVLISDLLEQRIEYQTISEDAPLLAFTIADGVINPEDKKSNKRDFLIKDKDNKRFELTEKDDIIYNPANVVFGAIHRNTLGRGVVSPIYKIFKCVHVDSSYMDCVVTRASFIHELSKYAEGSVTKLRTLAPESFLNIEITLPTDITQQHEIGTFIESLQAKIVHENAKVEKLKALKLSMLTKMFPKEGKTVPEIRFKGFTEEWEQRKLSDVSAVSTGCPFDSKDFTDDGTYLVITNGNIQDTSANVDGTVGNRITVSVDKALNSYLLDIGDILVTMDGTVGRTAKVSENGQILAQRVGRLKATIDSEFLYQWLNTGVFSKAMMELSHGGTIKHISLDEIRSFVSAVPTDADEQKQIGKYFKYLDNLITLHQRKYEKLIDTKKAFLEKLIGGEN